LWKWAGLKGHIEIGRFPPVAGVRHVRNFRIPNPGSDDTARRDSWGDWVRLQRDEPDVALEEHIEIRYGKSVRRAVAYLR
jgi:hypothetical protein